MEASSFTRRVLVSADVRSWAWWQIPPLLRSYVAAVTLTFAALTCFAASRTAWSAADLREFALLLGCGLVYVAATPRAAYVKGGLTRDFLTVWVLPIAVLLPPVYAMVTPIPLYLLTQWWVSRGQVYRRVFSVAATGLSYGAASLAFRAFPASFAGPSIGTGTHALTWAVAVAIAEIIGGRGHHVMIAAAVKLSDRTIRLTDMEFNREAVQSDITEFGLSVLITVVVAVNPLLAQSRVDTKTGLLNASTWEREAAAEISRAVRTHSPLALALVDIDHFKMVNDTYGHLVGDKALRAVTDSLRNQLRAYDLAGRFGGEEFAILLPHAREVDALNVAERLRVHIAGLSIPVRDDDESGPYVKVTISLGVAALDETSRGLTDLLAAADAALYHAKETGRNKTHVLPASAHAS